jgi:hypothetical protein
MQKRKYSLIEAITNTIIGFIVSLLIQLAIYPIMDISVKFHQNIIITCVFTDASILSWYFERAFYFSDYGR